MNLRKSLKCSFWHPATAFSRRFSIKKVLLDNIFWSEVSLKKVMNNFRSFL